MTINQLRNKAVAKLPLFTFILFVLQPLMDILSYWLQRCGLSNLPSLLLRFAVLGGVALAGYLFTERKRLYLCFALVCAVIWTGHIIACLQVGYQNPISDLTNYIRVIQMPLFAICLISFIKADKTCIRAVENGLIADFWVIIASVLMALATGTCATTYGSGGILGWFATTNAQSSIISLLSPIVIALTYRRKNFWLFSATVILSFAQLYFFGTRLAFFAMLITTFGLILVMFLARDFRVAYACVMLVCALICVAFFKVSPMYVHQNQYTQNMGEKQSAAVSMIQKAESDKAQQDDPAQEENPSTFTVPQREKLEALAVVYKFYTPKMCRHFGVERVMEKYDYTKTVSEITAVRRMKQIFCSITMDESPVTCRIFGLELDRLTCDNYIYDAENDFHGVYYLYGIAGLAAVIVFLGYFVFLIARCLIRDFDRYFTIEAGAFGIAFVLGLINAYFTAGVLRRPNSSFYLSAVLAVIYYLICLRDYDSEPKRKLLFGCKKRKQENAIGESETAQ